VTLRTRLILAFVAATVPPVALTWWTSVSLLERSLSMSPTQQVDELSKSLEKTGREVYQRARARLAEDVAAERIKPLVIASNDARVRDFWESGHREDFLLTPEGGKLQYLRRAADAVEVFESDLNGINLRAVTEQYKQARELLQSSRDRDLKRGFSLTFAVVAAAVWAASLAALVWWAHHLSRPVQKLTDALHRVAAGDLSVRR
jgi:methyl-accepting chemotaxis protein